MEFIAEINVMPLKALLDPQGKAVQHSLHTIGFPTLDNVRIGKHITIHLAAGSKEEANTIIDNACKNMLHNPIMESYDFVIKEA